MLYGYRYLHSLFENVYAGIAKYIQPKLKHQIMKLENHFSWEKKQKK